MSDVVWSVNIMLGVGLSAVVWIIYYILMIDKYEENNASIQDQENQEDS